jgi:hypothetical protein
MYISLNVYKLGFWHFAVHLAEWEFKITPCSYLNLWSLQDDKFDKLFNAYAKKVQLSPSDLTFTFDGDKLNSASTPQDHDLEDDDLIEVCCKSSWWLGAWRSFILRIPEWEVGLSLLCAQKLIRSAPFLLVSAPWVHGSSVQPLSDSSSRFLFCSALLFREMVRIVSWSIWVVYYSVQAYSPLCLPRYRGVSAAQVLIAWLPVYMDNRDFWNFTE